jgi:hypothetical protein
LDPKPKPKTEDLRLKKKRKLPKLNQQKLNSQNAKPVAEPVAEKPTEKKQAEVEKTPTTDTEKVTTQSTKS